MCCKILGVHELDKPVNTWCEHCEIGQGCRIYEDRPSSCATFQCVWFSNPWMADALRPDRSKVVLEGLEDHTGVMAMVDPGRRDAWKKDPMNAFLRYLVDSKRISVMVTHGPPKDESDAIFLLAKGRTVAGFMRSAQHTALNQLQRHAVSEGRPFESVVAEVLKSA